MTKKEIKRRILELSPGEELNISRCKVFRTLSPYIEEYYLFIYYQYKLIGKVDTITNFIHQEVLDDYIDEVLSD